MKKRKIIAVLCLGMSMAFLVSCGKEKEKNNPPKTNANIEEGEEERKDTEIVKEKTKITTVEEGRAFATQCGKKVEEIFKSHGMEYGVVKDYFRIHGLSSFEKLGKEYPCELVVQFRPFEQEGNPDEFAEEKYTMRYAIPVPENVDIEKDEFKEIDALIDILKLSDGFKSFSKDELKKELALELKGEGVRKDIEFKVIRSTRYPNCKLVEGGVELETCSVKRSLVKSCGTEYTFDKYDEYKEFNKKVNAKIFDKFIELGYREEKDREENGDFIYPIRGTKGGSKEVKNTYRIGVETIDPNIFSIDFRIEAVIKLKEDYADIDDKELREILESINEFEEIKHKVDIDLLVEEINSCIKLKKDSEKIISLPVYGGEFIEGVKDIKIDISKKEVKLDLTLTSNAIVEGEKSR